MDRAQGLNQCQCINEESRDDKAIITCRMAFLAVMVHIPCHPCAAALIDTNNSYNCCSGTVDSGH